MYRVFLVEDESLIRKGIKNLIAWGDYGFTFVGEAQDGELAWPLIQKQKPDIVITDIKMPFMDGLLLSSLIKKNMPETTVIILSGYDDFTYAKEAISIGIDQYLLKPLSKEQLIDLLQKVKIKKDEELEKNRYREQFSREVQEYLTSSHRGFFEVLVSGKYSLAEILERAEKLQLNLTAESYNIVLLLVEEDFGKVRETAETYDFQVELNKCFREDPYIEMFCMSVDMISFLVKSEQVEIKIQTQQCMEKINKILKPLGKDVKWSIVASDEVGRLSGIAQCYQDARRKLFHLDYFPYHREDESQDASGDLHFFDLDAAKVDQRIVEKFLTNGLTTELDSFIKDYFTRIGQEALKSLMFRQYVVLHIQFTVKAFMEKVSTTNEMTSWTLEGGVSIKDAIISIEGTKQYVLKLLEKALEVRDQVTHSRYTGMMDEVVTYMKEHYTDHEIDLTSVAQVGIMSPTYFSSVFSQQMGKTFVEYLTELRMEKARELLRCTDKSSGEIAYEIGYNDSHYFSFLFKKVNGCSPRDYRAGGKNS